ncbi:Peptidyl-prolyl cis-trans isomerase cyp6 [Tulasnella sp. 330]|nr:Peptidyl-prolyl cis-trans isomerase cyp6 [Tulasnella sp. 330]KAG8886089.1 Peptidyl-prolyl cis-trans isomerase cyp6 [Tulasnella sp. 331]KAG8890233.1 Peptidyl-prolyl cis-trans isomerase cyp6 [Tulasnella sp. 332]
MSVLLETSLGDIVIDLEVDTCPITCANFLKLCKIYYYNLNAFFNVSKDFIAQTGDPTATGTGGESASAFLSSMHSIPSSRYFVPEMLPRLKHTRKGTVSMAVAPSADGQPTGGCGSQFFITLADNIEYLDGKHAVFGHVVEGLETLDALNEAFVDNEGRPLKDVRIRHVVVLDDPFPDPEGLVVPPASPTRPPDAEGDYARIAENEDPLAELPEEEAEEQRRKQAAAASALTLEMVGDLPFANVRPPENVLFVCKLNSVTRDEDLELIFSRFGKIMSCQVIRDKKTGDSLQYAFIEFDKREDAEQAYFKMQNVLVDDRRIWVDFQSPSSTRAGLTTLRDRMAVEEGAGSAVDTISKSENDIVTRGPTSSIGTEMVTKWSSRTKAGDHRIEVDIVMTGAAEGVGRARPEVAGIEMKGGMRGGAREVVTSIGDSNTYILLYLYVNALNDDSVARIRLAASHKPPPISASKAQLDILTIRQYGPKYK